MVHKNNDGFYYYILIRKVNSSILLITLFFKNYKKVFLEDIFRQQYLYQSRWNNVFQLYSVPSRKYNYEGFMYKLVLSPRTRVLSNMHFTGHFVASKMGMFYYIFETKLLLLVTGWKFRKLYVGFEGNSSCFFWIQSTNCSLYLYKMSNSILLYNQRSNKIILNTCLLLQIGT